VFSHGLNSNRRSNFNQISELASNGCIVYSITHTDGTASMFDKDSKFFGYQLYEDEKREETEIQF